MAYEKDNEGVLFRNDRKENDNHPDYKGNMMVNGVDHWLSAWINEAKQSGKKYMKLSLTPKDEQPQGQQRNDPDPVDPDDIPF